ncbi:MAG: transcriptional repressor LexA [candidate division Zixibacteria bacterium]|nr:transcriptional repressor LexA [candidate division Zixibacteria bacterium]
MEIKKKLTARQKQILEYIEEMVNISGLPPTIREIGTKFSISSTNGVRSILEALENKGFIRRQKLVSRGIELVKRSPIAFNRIPIVGSVPAGLPITAIENREGEIAVDTSFLPNADVYCLRVKGESMINAGIFDGDFVLIDKNVSPLKGDIVVAVIGDDATVKKFYPEKQRIRLEPQNEAFGPIIVDRNTPGFYIAGRVVGLMRRMR